MFKNDGKENIDLNAVDGKSKNVSDENNVANKGCENKLFAPSSKGAPKKKALSSLFPPTKHEVLSSGGEDEPAALDQTRVNTPLRKDKMLTITKGQTGFTRLGEKMSLQHMVRLESTPIRKSKMSTLTKGLTGFTRSGEEKRLPRS